jgi:3-dehydroquinate synthase
LRNEKISDFCPTSNSKTSSMHPHLSNPFPEFGPLTTSGFAKLLDQYRNAKKLILVDENTHEYCLDALITQFDELTDAEVFLLPCGEENKVLEVCFQVWEAWSEYRVSRHDLVINLGGGVVTDMGGFIASIFKRGVTFVNIPTSLLAMVDASVGGKTGIDLGPYKNQIGTFANPHAVYIDTSFLSTLPEEEWLNGYAEMLKHGIISDAGHFHRVAALSPMEITHKLIEESVAIKYRIVSNDPLEQNQRKLLNFGHTVGHAIEGYGLTHGAPVPHGVAVAWGMLLEAQISLQKGLLGESDFHTIRQSITKFFPPIPDFSSIQDELFDLMKNDKKNNHGNVALIVLQSIGQADFNGVLSADEWNQLF